MIYINIWREIFLEYYGFKSLHVEIDLGKLKFYQVELLVKLSLWFCEEIYFYKCTNQSCQI